MTSPLISSTGFSFQCVWKKISDTENKSAQSDDEFTTADATKKKM